MPIGMESADGICTKIERSEPPYSSSSTVCLPSSVRRLASTQPADPAPTITKSKTSPLMAPPTQAGKVAPLPAGIEADVREKRRRRLFANKLVRRIDVALRDIHALQLGVVVHRRATVLAP